MTREPYIPDRTEVDPSWRKQALCIGLDVDLFYPAHGDDAPAQVAAARAICLTCPVVLECRAYAVEHREIVGVWGATTPQERRRLRRWPA